MDNYKYFDNLFRQTYPKLFFYARGIVGDVGDAEDVVEEVFCDLWSRIDELDTGERIQSLLYRSVFTRAINLLKRRGLRSVRIDALVEVNELRMEHMVCLRPTPYQLMETADLRLLLNQAIEELPAKCRQVFKMSYIDGASNADIALCTQTSLRTIEAHMYNALKYLRKRLASMGLYARGTA